ncbi:MAG: hypothetical protein QW700_07405 [Desulfurococcaceae archaeon]
MRKPTIAIVHGAICGGCDVALANSGGALLSVLESFDLAYWSVAVDARAAELMSLDKIDVTIFMGGIRTREDGELAKWIRERSSIVVAFGSCAAYGGIPGLAALIPPSELVDYVRATTTTTSYGRAGEVQLPKLPEIETYRALPDAIKVDVVVPGCPPPVKSVNHLVDVLLKYVKSGGVKEPVIVAGLKALCETCPRKPKEPSKMQINDVKRIHEVRIREDACFLEQGILCLGPVTREGCDHSCIKVNMPCTGCFGPLPGAEDVGLRYIAGVLALIASDRERELMEPGLARVLDKVIDRLGVLYRYTLPGSRLYRLRLSIKGVSHEG